jgi:hypothetical protein
VKLKWLPTNFQIPSKQKNPGDKRVQIKNNAVSIIPSKAPKIVDMLINIIAGRSVSEKVTAKFSVKNGRARLPIAWGCIRLSCGWLAGFCVSYFSFDIFHVFRFVCYRFCQKFINNNIFSYNLFYCFIKNFIYLFFSSIPSKNIFIYLFFHVYFLLKFKNVCGWHVFLIYEIIK